MNPTWRPFTDGSQNFGAYCAPRVFRCIVSQVAESGHVCDARVACSCKEGDQ